MKNHLIIKQVFFYLFLFSMSNICFTQTFVSGNVSGIWKLSNSPYYVSQGDITIASADTLIIEPGVEVYFNIGGFKFNINGSLFAEGSIDSLITFGGIPSNTGRWQGLYFYYSSPNKKSKLQYCVIRDAGYDDHPAILFNSYHNAIVNNCIILNNKKDGVEFDHSYVTISQCTILNNGANGINCKYSIATISSNILLNNANSGIAWDFWSFSRDLIYRYNLVWNNISNPQGPLSLVNMNGDSCDENLNILYDPLFVDYDNGDFHLTKESPCIDAGDLTLRDPDGSIADIGAFYYNKTTHVNYPNNLIKPNLFMLSQNYPNPFNSETIISYIIPKPTFVSIKIFDINGKEIETLVNENHSAGNFKVKLNAKDLPSGLYFYRLISGDFIKTRKFILTK